MAIDALKFVNLKDKVLIQLLGFQVVVLLDVEEVTALHTTEQEPSIKNQVQVQSHDAEQAVCLFLVDLLEINR